jgi:hypothetical protein
MSEGTYCRQTCIAVTYRIVPFGFDVSEEIEHQGCVEITQRLLRRCLACCALRTVQQEPEGVAIGRDRSWAGVLLLDQALCKEALEQRRELGGNSE